MGKIRRCPCFDRSSPIELHPGHVSVRMSAYPHPTIARKMCCVVRWVNMRVLCRELKCPEEHTQCCCRAIKVDLPPPLFHYSSTHPQTMCRSCRAMYSLLPRIFCIYPFSRTGCVERLREGEGQQPGVCFPVEPGRLRVRGGGACHCDETKLLLFCCLLTVLSHTPLVVIDTRDPHFRFCRAHRVVVAFFCVSGFWAAVVRGRSFVF